MLVVPSGFTLDIDSDRPDLIRVEGVLRPQGAPASPVSLTFDQGGVEVAPGGLFDMFGRNLTLRTDSSVLGGELRDAGILTIADRVDDDVTFTQSSGVSDINSDVRVGYATSTNNNPHGELIMNGGTLSIGGSLSVGTAASNLGANTVFSEGVYRQTDGVTTINNRVSIADKTGSSGVVELLGGSMTVGDFVSVATGTNSDGRLLLDGASLTVNGELFVGQTNGSVVGELTQASGDLSADRLTIRSNSRYELSGGTLSIGDRFDLLGVLDFNGGNATITVADEGVVEWAAGTLLGSAANTHYSAGVDSESYFPVGFDPMVEFASFSSQGLVHTEGTPLTVPVGFTLDVTSDRPDLIRVEGVLRPEGSPGNPQSLTFNQGGVEVTPSGLFNLFGARLTLRSDMLVDGGEVRNAGFVTIGDVNGEEHTFTQTSGTTDINSDTHVGLALAGASTASGVLNMNGGTLSIGGSLEVGSNNQNFGAFAEGVYRQTAGTATVAGRLDIASGTGQGATGAVELLGGSLTVGGSVEIASHVSADGTLAIGGGTLAIGDDLTIGRTTGDSVGQLTQTAGDLSLDQLVIRTGSRYDLTGGTLTVREGFDLAGGTLNLGGGAATINVADDAVVEWTTGALIGSAASTNYSAGVDSESYFPTGFDPFTRFASFSSQGLVQASGTAVVVPSAYEGSVFILNADNIAIAGQLTQIEDGAINAASVSINGGLFRGNGVVTTDEFINSGVLSIGTPGEIAELTISGPYEQTALGSLEIDLAGFLPGQSFDQLVLGEIALLSGELLVNIAGSFTPAPGATFQILTATQITGEFDTVNTSMFPLGLGLEVEYQPQSVLLRVIEVGLGGDFNLDGVVDVADYTVWRDNLGAVTEASIGGNGDGQNGVDIGDYLVWRENFGMQASSSAQPSQSTPEPSTLALAFLAAGLAVSTRLGFGRIT